MFWKEQSIHVIDFEGSPRYGVVEYGVVTVLGGQIAQTRTALCQPDTEMTAKEISLHGIRTRDAAGAPPFAEHRELFFNLRKSGVLCAHHASVENGFLKRNWPYPPLSDDFSAPLPNGTPEHSAGIAPEQSTSAMRRHSVGTAPEQTACATPEHSTAEAPIAAEHTTPAGAEAPAPHGNPVRPQIADWGPWIDTRALYAAIYPDLKSHSLGELIRTFALTEPLAQLAAEHCPAPRRKAHCALYDALASALLLLHLGTEDGFEHLTLQWLLEHSAASAHTLTTRRQQTLL